MNLIHKAQLKYASTQPWFPSYIDNLRTNCDKNLEGTDSITFILNWNTMGSDEADFWHNMDDTLDAKFFKSTSKESLLNYIEKHYPPTKFPEYYI